MRHQLTVLEFPLAGNWLSSTKREYSQEDQDRGVRQGAKHLTEPIHPLRKYPVNNNPAIYSILFCPVHDIHMGTTLKQAPLPSRRREITWKEDEI